MDDLISRRQAIDALERNSCNTQRAIDAVNALPSAQPERKKGEWYLHREIQNLKAEKAKEEAQRWVEDVRRHCEKRFYEMMEEISKREEQSEPEGAMSVDPTQVDIDWETLKELAGQIAAGEMSEDFKNAVYEANAYKQDTIDAALDPRESSVSKAMMEAIAKQEETDEDGPAPDQDPVDWIVNGPRMTILTPEEVQS